MNVCSICLEEIHDKSATLNCNHTFHTKCIREWFLEKFEQNCPMCRSKMTGYKNKMNTRGDTLTNRIEKFEKEYYTYILQIYSTNTSIEKNVIFEKLLKLIDTNRFMLECSEFRRNIRECFDEPGFTLNKSYWIDKLRL